LRARGWEGEMLMISAYQDVQYLREALKAQAVDFLFKPVQMSELMDGVKRAIQRRSARKHEVVFDEKSVRAGLDAAMNAYDCGKLEEGLLSLWNGLRQTEKPLSERTAETICILRYCAEKICLTDVEGAFEGICVRLKAAESDEAAAEILRDGIVRTIAMLREHGKDWHCAVEITRCIEQNLSQVDANFLAERLHVSRASFYRIFNRISKDNLSDYILKIRMRIACSLLVNTDMRVYEIANKTGYGDVNYFTKQFRKMFGALPTEYRNQQNRRV